jgi:hypothetical protein
VRACVRACAAACVRACVVCAHLRVRARLRVCSSFKTKYKADAGGSARFDETFDIEKPGAPADDGHAQNTNEERACA